MSRRIEIQLTSRTGDDSWTWRAAGAREPRGTLPASLVPEAAKEGDVLRAEIETTMDGIEVVSLGSAAPTAKPARAETIEVLGSGRGETGVSWTLAPKAKRSGDRRGGPRRDGDRRGGPPRGERRGDDRRGGPRRDGERRDPRGRQSAVPQVTEHRNAMLASLPPGELPIAEQLLRGGIPAVRQAIDEQNGKARSAGQPPIAPEGVLALAEGLLPRTTLAAWKDRAAGALQGGKETRLRDLRAVVTASRSVSLDEEGKAMAKTLRETLAARSEALSSEWSAKMEAALDEGRTADALRLSARAPEPSTRLSAELATKLSDAASAGLTAETEPRAWMVLLDAVCESPVRRTVKPEGIPAEADTEAAARKAAGLVPALAKLLGLKIPPPPPRRVVHHRREPVSPRDEG